MTYRVLVHGHPAYARVRSSAVRAALAALKHQSAPAGSVGVALVGETRMRRLNREFARRDASTDVLAFPDRSRDPDSGEFHLGDVVIAMPVAVRQARRAGHSVRAEVSLLTVHGVLHLLGHDHAALRERKRMELAQQAILSRLGLPPPTPQEAP